MPNDEISDADRATLRWLAEQVRELDLSRSAVAHLARGLAEVPQQTRAAAEADFRKLLATVSEQERVLTASLRQHGDGIAVALLIELRKLRAERDAGRHPVRRGTRLGEAEIACLAISLLTAFFPAAAEEHGAVGCLLGELLHVDRHRATYAEGESFRRATTLDAYATWSGNKLSLREIARVAGVSPMTIAKWRTLSEYRERVDGIAAAAQRWLTPHQQLRVQWNGRRNQFENEPPPSR